MSTIFALATPAGKSGVAVLRLSGDCAFAIAREIAGEIDKPRYSYYRELRAADNVILDQALVIGFHAPASFTGEDVVEFHIHGGRAVIRAVSERLIELGAVAAERGEFTRRALENGKLDMLQVEALGDFIDADTEAQRQHALSGFQAEASHWSDELREKLVQAMSLVTLSIDFVDEDLPDDLIASIGVSVKEALANVSRETKRSERSQSLREGFRVALIGRPNVGKSSLLNAIAGRDMAITTEIPGTTRDILEVFVDLNGLPVIFLDTAGLRETDNVVESIGIERSLLAASEADLRIFLYDDEADIVNFPISQQVGDLLVQTKGDLNGREGAISSKTGEGIDGLLAKVSSILGSDAKELGFFSHQRQIDALNDAKLALERAQGFAEQGEMVYELLAESLREAVFALDRLIGRVDVEDMLDVIFSKFCIGK